MRRLALASALVLACNGGDDDDTGKTSDDGAPSCDTTIAALLPEDGDANVFYRDAIEVSLSAPDPGWSIQVIGPSGGAVAGTLAVDTDTTKVLDAQLAPSTDYTLRIDYCRGKVETTFRTSELGMPLDPDELDQKVFRLDITTASVNEPETVSDSVFSLLGEFVLLIKVTHEAGVLSFLGAVGDDIGGGVVVQDPCTRTFAFPVDISWTNPSFRFETDSLGFDWDDSVIALTDVVASGTFSADSRYLAAVALAGSLDTRDLAPILLDDPDPAPSAVCDFLDPFGIPCAPCGGDAGQPYCVRADLEDITGATVVASVVEVTREEILANPFCQP